MARIKGIEPRDAGVGTRFLYWLIERAVGRIPEGARIRAYDPMLLWLSGFMDQRTAAAQTLPPVLKELAQLKVAALVGCPF